MKIMKLITCLVLPTLWSLGNATTNVREEQRNGMNATVRCETDVLYAVMIWYIGNKRSVPDRIEFNGRLATATETILVTKTIQVTCIVQNRSTSENDTLTLRPREDPPTIVTSLTTDTDDGVPAGTPAGTLPTTPNVSTNYGDKNVTVEIPTPPNNQENEQPTHIYVVIGVVGVVVVLCFVAAVLVGIAYCCRVHGPRSRGLHVPDALHMCTRAPLDDSGSLVINPTDEPKGIVLEEPVVTTFSGSSA